MSHTTVLLLIAACLMLQPLSTDLYLPSLPQLATDFGVPVASVQQTLSAFMLGMGGAQLISGPLSDRIGRRPVILGGLAIYVSASVACALAPGLSVLVIFRFFQAVGCCTALVASRAIVNDLYHPADGARVIARASSLMSAAPLLGPIAGGYLQIAFGWRAAFVAHIVVGTLVLLAALSYLQESNRALNPDATRPARLMSIYLNVMRTPVFWAYALPGAMSYASIFVFISGSSFVLIKVLGMSTQFYGFLFAFGVAGFLGGTLICRRFVARIGLARTLAAGTTLGMLSGLVFLAAILAGAQHWLLVTGAMFMIMAAHGLNFPCVQAGAVAPFPQNAGAAAGLFGALTMTLALVVGIWVGGTYDGTLNPLAIITAVMTSALFILTRVLQHLARPKAA